MNWLNEWAKWQVIFMYIGLGICALCLIAFIVLIVVQVIIYLYKSHSKKYEWNCLLNRYVKKENKDEKRINTIRSIKRTN